MADIDKLKNDAERADRLANLKAQSGWQDVLVMFEHTWLRALAELRTSSTLEKVFEAQAKMNVVEDLLKKVDDKINFGEQQMAKLKKMVTQKP